MLRIFIAAAFQGDKNKAEIEYLCSLVKNSGYEDFCFIRDVEHYEQVFDNPKDLMKSSLDEIKKSDFILIDVTDKPTDRPTGRLIEMGIAYALGKKVIVIMKIGTQLRNTIKGIASMIIEYDKIEEIVGPLSLLSITG